MIFRTQFGRPEDLHPYQIHSRREIIRLLQSLQQQNQLVSMMINEGAEAIVTAILEIDEAKGTIVIDHAQSTLMNQRIIKSDNISFETVLDHIRILFFATEVGACIYEGKPALSIPIPSSLIRLQRREYYRIPAPAGNPIRCIIPIPGENESAPPTTIMTTLQNVSGGGIAIVDEKKKLDNAIGSTYHNCMIDLPGGTLVITTLQIRNCHEVTLANGKTIRRLGCRFVDLPKTMLATIQRYITGLERERNAKITGMV